MNYVSLGYYNLSVLTSAVGLSSRTGGITSSTNANPIVITDNGTPADHGLLGGTITNVTYGPLVITSAAHGLTSGDRVIISGMLFGALSLNNQFNPFTGTFNSWRVNVLDANTFSVYDGPSVIQSDTTFSVGGKWYRHETFLIEGHTTNTAANGAWPAIKATSSTFTLLGSTGNGVGGASGTWRTIPHGAIGALIQAIGGTVNWRDDGTDPTASASGGNELYVADEPLLFTGDLWKFRAINQAANSGASLNVQFVKW